MTRSFAFDLFEFTNRARENEASNRTASFAQYVLALSATDLAALTTPVLPALPTLTTPDFDALKAAVAAEDTRRNP